MYARKSHAGMPLIKAIVRDIWSVNRVQHGKKPSQILNILFHLESFEAENLRISRSLCNNGLFEMTAILPRGSFASYVIVVLSSNANLLMKGLHL